MLGHPYTEAQHKQMAGIVSGRRQRFTEIRKIPIDANVEPAMRFDAWISSNPWPSDEPSMELSDGRAGVRADGREESPDKAGQGGAA